jgi:hypothetical protein
MFTALGNYQNMYATSTFSGLSNGTLSSNLNGTMNILTPFNDEADNTRSNILKDCANCIGNGDINPGTAAPLISNDNPDENDIDSGGSDGNGNNDDGDGNDNGDLGSDGNDNGDLGSDGNDNGDNPSENDVSGNSPFSLPFNSQFADPSDDTEGDISDNIPFP